MSLRRSLAMVAIPQLVLRLGLTNLAPMTARRI